jgi:pyruvate/2-oxoglutarate dehydrogenase complex dihydrolipoamide acyltransferase (E2) component
LKQQQQLLQKLKLQAIPEGVEIINMPRLSDTMEEGTVASWLKQVGDAVEEGDILAEIETDKATMEFESFFSGTLLHIGIQVGETAAVDTLLAIIGPEGTDVAAILAAPATAPKANCYQNQLLLQQLYKLKFLLKHLQCYSCNTQPLQQVMEE